VEKPNINSMLESKILTKEVFLSGKEDTLVKDNEVIFFHLYMQFYRFLSV